MLKSHCAESARVPDPGAFSLGATIIECERTRACKSCGFVGSELLFKKGGSSGRSNTCKRCDAARARDREQRHRDLINAQRRARYRRDIEKHRRRSRERARTARGLEINRAAVARYRANYPDKDLARRKVALALKRGTLVKPTVCQIHGCKCAAPLHGHHVDYAKPLAVDWLCRNHHEQVHHEGKPLRLKPSADRKYTRPPKQVFSAV